MDSAKVKAENAEKENGGTRVFCLKAELEQFRKQAPPGAKVGFVPTMGALHAGHMALIKKARKQCDQVVVSIFVNPLQFGVNEDLSKYPRPFEKDLQFCQNAGVDAVFHPPVFEIYGKQEFPTTTVHPPLHLLSGLCASFRPGHFVGVSTVVLKLFNMVRPDIAYFGEKDYQQLVIVRQMAADLNLPLKIVAVATGRDHDGLALSSRNAYLNAEERALAPVLYESLRRLKDDCFTRGMALAEALSERRGMLNALSNVRLEYLEACDAETLAPLSEVKLPMVFLLAARIGSVRLIDNIVVSV